MLRHFPPPFLRAHRLQRLRLFHSSSTLYKKSLKAFNLADIGEGITECEIIKWSIQPSARVEAFDPLCEVQSDKASVEITSPYDGVLKEILVKEGDIAKVGEGLCLIEVESEGEAEAEGDLESRQDGDATTGKQVEERVQEEERIQSQERATPTTTTTEHQAERRKHPMDPTYAPPASTHSRETHRPSSVTPVQDVDVLAPPSVRFFARQNGVDLRDIAPGSGKGGRVEKADVLAFMDGSRSRATETREVGRVEGLEDVTIELGRTRYGMYKAMEKSLLVPHFSYTSFLDLTPLHHLLPVLNSHIPASYLPDSHPNSFLNQRQRYLSAAVSPFSIYKGSQPEQQGPEVPQEARYAKLTYLPFLLKTLSQAMMEWPIFRSTITDSSSPSSSPSTSTKPSLSIRPHADIALALSTPTGLYSPVLKSVERHSVYSIAGEVKRISELARGQTSRLTKEDFDGTPASSGEDGETRPRKGATLTVSNVGAIGHGTGAHPVLVPGGGVAIVAVGRARWEWDADPAYDNYRDTLDAFSLGFDANPESGLQGTTRNGLGRRRLLLPISFSADHRVVEGAEMAAFVETWRGWVEKPGRGVGVGV
ncbi:hypothetical protein D9758_016908 [Tetrapyrgos nigripes]|uniref:Dihydrolipoamide acetyltransferase component of pyruvate dehydrogenase complex n=1 Tax=Tetrapyrgos nigripes TaxID=182062 RepID=A0A8H5C5A1_9AGAR|nr:hypothetical protein D9758_016908 [Tetrapyrgos nigripes]